MAKKQTVKNGLKEIGSITYLVDGDWVSTPFYSYLQPSWQKNKADFEKKMTPLGEVSADYYYYIGLYDHKVDTLSENARLIYMNKKYAFKKCEPFYFKGEVIYYTGILRKVNNNEIS